MSSQDDNYSEEELDDVDDWPVDFFDNDYEQIVEELSKPTITDVLPLGLICTIIELLGLRDRIDVFRCANRVMRDALTSSSWTRLRNSTLTVSQPQKEIHGLPIAQGKPLRITTQELSFSFEGWNSLELAHFEPNRIDEFLGFHKLCAQPHVKELILNHAEIDGDLIEPFNKVFDDSFTLDKLTIRKCDSITKSMRKLIIRAQREVVIELEPLRWNAYDLLEIERPVKLCLDSDGIRNELDETLFKDLLSKGHSLIRFSAEFSKVDAIEKAVQTVYTSVISQKIYLRGLHYVVCKEYVEKTGAKLVPNRQQVYAREFLTYIVNQRTIVCLVRFGGEPREGRLVVRSKSCPVDTVEKDLLYHVEGAIAI